MSTAARQRSALVVSLDFELFWGARDHTSLERHRPILEGAREAIPRILDLFCEHEIHATWATVGFLFARDRDELTAALPDVRPTYVNRRLSPYPELDRLGKDENEDPYHYAPSLIREIASRPGQEIGSHTLSHYYCLERGQTLEAFEADLEAARTLAASQGYELRSLVFPRNQYGREHVSALPRHGIDSFRGCQTGWMYSASAREREGRGKRLARLADAYLPVSGFPRTTMEDHGGAVDVPASRFLRPYMPVVRHLEPLRLLRITEEMTRAAHRNDVYHLWWHPENFGSNLEQNLTMLRKVLRRFDDLRGKHNFLSVNMGEVAASEAAVRGRV